VRVCLYVCINCKNDRLDHAFADTSVGFAVQLREDVDLWVTENIKRCTAVMVLQRRDVVVCQRQLSLSVHLYV